MTTALIGTEGSVRACARVGLVAGQGSESLAEAVVHIGHEVVTCASWDDLRRASETQGLDLVICPQTSLGGMPDGWTVPVLRMDDDGAPTEESLAPLLAMAVELASKADRLREAERVVGGIRRGEAMVGNTPAMRRLMSAVARAADCDATVLIEGPRGAGKSLAARSVHLKSRRGGEPLMAYACAELSAETLAEAMAACCDTTLVLESVDELPAAAQSVLVKHLKERSSSRAPSLVRLIATTSAHIPELVARGAFREDLFYRLHAFPILVPSLQERADDIQAIADAILDAGVPRVSGRQGFTAASRALLAGASWPGNVAQLEATIRRAQLLAGGGPIDREHLLAPNPEVPASAPARAATQARDEDAELTEDDVRPFEDEERDILGRALRATKGNVRRAAQLLGIGRATLYRKIQQYDLRLH